MPRRSMFDNKFEVNASSMFMLKVRPRRNKSNPRKPFDVRVWIRYELPTQGSPRLSAIEINVDPDNRLERSDLEQISDSVFAHLAKAESEQAGIVAMNRIRTAHGSDSDITEPEVVAFEAARASSDKRILTERRSRSLTPDHLDRVAMIVRRAQQLGDSKIQQAVMREIGIPLKTARNHIKKARETGRLEMPNGEIINVKR